MSDGLRVMIYDKTALDDGLDITENNDNLTMSWAIGAKLYRLFRSVDIAKGVSSWDEALDWLNTVFPGKKISQIQFWGHGSPGRAYIGRKFISKIVASPTYELHDKFVKLSDRMDADSLFWFRNCSMFCGEPGQEFAKEFSTLMGCRVAAHTHIIGPWQAGLHTIKPGQEPYWPVDEGIEEGPASWPTKFKWSRPWTKNSIFCLYGSVPRGW